MNKTIIAIIIIVIVGFGAYKLIKMNKVDVDSNMESTENTVLNDETNTGEVVGDVEEKGDVGTDNDDKMVANVKEFTVDGSNFKFLPSTITVKKGDTVKITLKNVAGFHDFNIDEFNVATKQIKEGDEETVTFVADKTGSFEYYCSVGKHRANGMVGTLIVE